MLKKGDKAPYFSLQDVNGDEKSLNDLKKEQSVLLLFFPLAFSSVCTSELCSVRDNMKIYESLDVNIAAVSVDSFYCLRAFKKSQNYNFSLLSDFNREASEKYEVLYNNYYGMKGVAKRSAFVVDKDGTIQYAEVLEDSSKVPEMSAIQEVLQNLQAINSTAI